MKIYTPKNARDNINSIIKEVTEYNTPIEITDGGNTKESVVVISKDYYNAIQETLYLVDNGIDNIIKDREHDEIVSLEKINWDTL